MFNRLPKNCHPEFRLRHRCRREGFVVSEFGNRLRHSLEQRLSRNLNRMGPFLIRIAHATSADHDKKQFSNIRLFFATTSYTGSSGQKCPKGVKNGT